MVTKPRIFVVYGYHPEEKFAIDVGVELSKKNLENVITKLYDGEKERPGLDRRFQFTLKRYLRNHLPFDYAIDLHDAGPIMEKVLKFGTIMCAWVSYETRKEVPNKITTQIEQYCDGQLPKRLIFPSWQQLRNMSKRYDRVSVEYYPHMISKEDGIEILMDLIRVLQAV
ncbi:MAG: hypothetical protein QXH91_04320 [Candidatus Bathyarchaeia archaeon]